MLSYWLALVYIDNMMTFLVHPDFAINATFLSLKHLGKQRLECIQIYNAICKIKDGVDKSSGRLPGWINHPIVRAWVEYTDALKYYTNCIINEFIARGCNNNIPLYSLPATFDIPWWATWDRLHQSHQAMLVRKDPWSYADKFNVDPEYTNYGYIWPADLTVDHMYAPLAEITAPIPKELVKPVFCTGILKSGVRAGQTCNILVKDASLWCRKHRKVYDNTNVDTIKVATPDLTTLETPESPIEGYCPAILRSGKSKGSMCNRKLKDGSSHCSFHRLK